MLFRQLEYFVAVAREGHFARAAEACYVSQPALSASIAKLERELGVTLINRGQTFEGLTAEGERLVVWARRILAEKDGFKAELTAVQSGITGTLRLGVEPTASTTLALPVAAFCATHPLATVQVETRLSATELHRHLRDFELDAAIAPFDGADAALHTLTLYEERYVLVAPHDRLTPRTSVMRWADAAQLTPALLTPDMRIRQVIDSACAQNGIELRPRVETDSVAALYAMVDAGDCTTIVPHTWLHALPVVSTAIVVPLVEPDVRAPISLGINGSGRGSVAARAFMSVAKGLALNALFDRTLPCDHAKAETAVLSASRR